MARLHSQEGDAQPSHVVLGLVDLAKFRRMADGTADPWHPGIPLDYTGHFPGYVPDFPGIPRGFKCFFVGFYRNALEIH